MQITHSTRDGCLVLSLTGRITVTTASQVQHTLLRSLADGPLAVICDLGGVDALDPVCATVFATVANHPASRWPTTSLLLCGARPPVAEVLERLEVRHFLPLYDTLQEALDAVADRPAELLLWMELHRELHIPGRHPAAAAAPAHAGVRDVVGPTSLTAVERGLLPLLATHLTFREIGERLNLSSQTVRAQAISIYRKLGVSSRSQAIQHARQRGLPSV